MRQGLRKSVSELCYLLTLINVDVDSHEIRYANANHNLNLGKVLDPKHG